MITYYPEHESPETFHEESEVKGMLAKGPESFEFNSDQIGIPIYNLPKGIQKRLVELVESNGFHEDYSVGQSYFSINFKLNFWFTHKTNKYYPDLPIKNTSNPFPEIKKFFLEQLKKSKQS